MTQQILGGFPTRRLRRLRKHDFSRRLVAKYFNRECFILSGIYH